MAVEFNTLFRFLIACCFLLYRADGHRAHRDVPVELVIGHLPLGDDGDPRLEGIQKGGFLLLFGEDLQIDGAGVIGDADGEDGP